MAIQLVRVSSNEIPRSFGLSAALLLGQFARSTSLAISIAMICSFFHRTASAQDPPSRPILFVHGWCSSVDDWSHLYSALFNGLPQALYPTPVPLSHQQVYYVEYNSHSNSIQFAIEVDPSNGISAGLTPINESDIPSSARLFAIQFHDPILNSNDPANLARISILNKAYELSQVIKHIVAITGVGKVNIVAHSMGGLDIRAYIENLASPTDCYDYLNNVPYYASPCSPGGLGAGYADNVGAIITIDTPHAGSPLADSSVRSLLPDTYACQKYDTVSSWRVPSSPRCSGSIPFEPQVG